MGQGIDNSAALKIFRSSRTQIIAVGVSMLLFMAAAITLYLSNGLTLLGVAGIGLALFAVVAFIDTLLLRVVISADELEIYANFRRRMYPRSAFIAASWAKGSPVALQLREGGWLKLPPVGPGSQGMTNILRAWIKKP